MLHGACVPASAHCLLLLYQFCQLENAPSPLGLMLAPPDIQAHLVPFLAILLKMKQLPVINVQILAAPHGLLGQNSRRIGVKVGENPLELVDRHFISFQLVSV